MNSIAFWKEFIFSNDTIHIDNADIGACDNIRELWKNWHVNDTKTGFEKDYHRLLMGLYQMHFLGISFQRNNKLDVETIAELCARKAIQDELSAASGDIKNIDELLKLLKNHGCVEDLKGFDYVMLWKLLKKVISHKI